MKEKSNLINIFKDKGYFRVEKFFSKNFIDEFGNPYSQIIIDNDGTLSVEFGAYGVPETFIIDKNKKIIKKFIGPINKEITAEIKLIIE